MVKQIDINCDMGEGLDTDAALMPFISSANIACGSHAGDADTIKHTIELAIQHDVAIGAHPGFADKAHFGRREIQLSQQELADLVSEQLYILQQAAMGMGATLRHVKPHGALYNMAAKDAMLAKGIAEAVKKFNPRLLLLGLSGSHSITAGRDIGLTTASEVFADRSYQDDGSLTPRSQPHALIEETERSMAQVLQMILEHTVTSVNGRKVAIRAETVCIHGDGAHAVDFARSIFHCLQQNNISIQPISI